MKIITAENLESTGYRCLFEYIKEYGIESALSLFQSINNLPEKEIMIRQAIMDSQNDLATILLNNADIIRYIREHKEEFSRFSVVNENVLAMLENLKNDMSLLKTYLENAKRLEELKVYEIKWTSSIKESCPCDLYRDNQNKIINITKYYTDGDIVPEEEKLMDEMFHYSEIPFRVFNAKFLFQASNNEHLQQYRGIYLTDFGFDGSKLPSEEEVESYDIPRQLLKK